MAEGSHSVFCILEAIFRFTPIKNINSDNSAEALSVSVINSLQDKRPKGAEILKHLSLVILILFRHYLINELSLNRLSFTYSYLK